MNVANLYVANLYVRAKGDTYKKLSLSSTHKKGLEETCLSASSGNLCVGPAAADDVHQPAKKATPSFPP